MVSSSHSQPASQPPTPPQPQPQPPPRARSLLLISAGFDAAEGDTQGKMRVTPAGFATMTSLLLKGTSCPVAAALEGGYNAPVTSSCCEAVLRALLGERTVRPPAQFLARTTEPTLRAVIAAQREYWPVLREQALMMDDFFA
eukprot:3097152-Prymnesium_polylepis.1